MGERERFFVMGAALLALFLGAMDALIMSTAMPTIVADLGGLHLYSWVYTTYFLSRAVSLPIFGKLADTYRTRTLFMASIGLFVVSSVFAGFAPNMAFLVIARVFQGIGAGGNFALVYIALADVSPPEKRGRAMSFASFVWGLASVLGPTLGGIIVTWTSWRWIFLVNVPLGLASLAGISLFLVETREKKGGASLDLWGAFALSVTILAFLLALMMGGRTYGWGSGTVLGLLALAGAAGVGFYLAEKGAADPILSPGFFAIRGFAAGNSAVFLSSFAIFSLFAFGPLFIQGALGKSPVQVGVAMLWLSLGWSLGSILLGQFVDRLGGEKLRRGRGRGVDRRMRRDPDLYPSDHHGGLLGGILPYRHRHGICYPVDPGGGTKQSGRSRSGCGHGIQSVCPYPGRHRGNRCLRQSGLRPAPPGHGGRDRAPFRAGRHPSPES